VILLFAIVSGLVFGWVWARWHRRTYRVPELRATWLVLAGFLPQLIVAYLPATHSLVPNGLAAASLSASLVAFLAFVWINRRLPGMPVLLAGLILNLAVMAANGGWMPITPENASRVLGTDVSQHVALGGRFGQKDVLLPSQDIHFGLLADRFLPPAWFPYQVAFSAGDILIAAGAFWLLASPPASIPQQEAE
jgi:hypothetical protein